METFLRFFLPAYLLLFLTSIFFLRLYIVRQQSGTAISSLAKRQGSNKLIDLLFLVIFILRIGVIFIFSLFPSGYQLLSPIKELETPLAATFGLLLLSGSLVWIVKAQSWMGKAWRIGIDRKNITELVTDGIFSRSRNPIFLGMRVNALGLFLAIPNILTLAMLVLGDVLLQIHVRYEEQHLFELHGESFTVYCQKVRRWL
jgi:protein-S-isoprenylcysteine O-methyltransferase Ste14